MLPTKQLRASFLSDDYFIGGGANNTKGKVIMNLKYYLYIWPSPCVKATNFSAE